MLNTLRAQAKYGDISFNDTAVVSKDADGRVMSRTMSAPVP